MTTSTVNSTAWQRTSAGQRALRALTDTISTDPAALPEAVSQALNDFDSLDDLLISAHSQWVRTFDAQIDPLLEMGAYGDDEAFARVWGDTARLMSGTARLLDHYADHPAVVRAHAQHVRRAQAVLAVRLPDAWVPAPPVRRRSRGFRFGRALRVRVA